jgi:hypothetical protein
MTWKGWCWAARHGIGRTRCITLQVVAFASKSANPTHIPNKQNSLCNPNSSQPARNDEPIFLIGVNISTQEPKLKYHVREKSYEPEWTERHIPQGAREGSNKLWSAGDAWRWGWRQIRDSPWIDPLTAAREALLCLLCSTLRFALTCLLYPLPDSLQACKPVFTLGRHSRQQKCNREQEARKEQRARERGRERGEAISSIHPYIHSFMWTSRNHEYHWLGNQQLAVFFGNCVL